MTLCAPSRRVRVYIRLCACVVLLALHMAAAYPIGDCDKLRDCKIAGALHVTTQDANASPGAGASPVGVQQQGANNLGVFTGTCKQMHENSDQNYVLKATKFNDGDYSRLSALEAVPDLHEVLLPVAAVCKMETMFTIMPVAKPIPWRTPAVQSGAARLGKNRIFPTKCKLEVLQAIETLHKNGWGYSDLNRGNVMIHNDRCVLIDHDSLCTREEVELAILNAHREYEPGDKWRPSCKPDAMSNLFKSSVDYGQHCKDVSPENLQDFIKNCSELLTEALDNGDPLPTVSVGAPATSNAKAKQSRLDKVTGTLRSRMPASLRPRQRSF